MNTRRLIGCILAVALVLCLVGTAEARGPQKYKNVIFVIPDGCSQSIQTLARYYKGEDLTVDALNCGMVRTDMANSVITGSAAAATAFACGHKTTVRFLGVAPRTNDLLTTFTDFDPDRAYAPMASILELAKRNRKATGLVATSRITHATPAAFACHIADRGWDNDIMEHLVYNNLDVVMGGGYRHLLPTSVPGGKRTDGENLEDVLLDRGYTIVTTKDEMDAVVPTPGMKLWGGFAMSHMDAEIDRPVYNPDEPALADMLAKALEVLSLDPNGFFVMCEASQVDWAGHNNDPAYMVTDFIEFDEAVKVAVDFAKANGQTLVVAFPDHNTGGMKIGHYYTSMSYTATTVEDLVEPIKGMTVTAESVVAEMGGDYSDANMIATIKALWNIDATPVDIAEINDLAPDVGLSYALARVISKNHTVIGWTTHGHNGEDVPVWMYPTPEGIGTIDNTDLAKMGADAMSWFGCGRKALDRLTKELYIDVEDAFPGQWELDKSDPENFVLVIKDFARLPVSKDYLEANGRQYDLGSLVVYAPTRDGDTSDDGSIHTIVEDKTYIPQRAVLLVKLLSRGRPFWGWGFRY